MFSSDVIDILWGSDDVDDVHLALAQGASARPRTLSTLLTALHACDSSAVTKWFFNRMRRQELSYDAMDAVFFFVVRWSQRRTRHDGDFDLVIKAFHVLSHHHEYHTIAQSYLSDLVSRLHETEDLLSEVRCALRALAQRGMHMTPNDAVCLCRKCCEHFVVHDHDIVSALDIVDDFGLSRLSPFGRTLPHIVWLALDSEVELVRARAFKTLHHAVHDDLYTLVKVADMLLAELLQRSPIPRESMAFLQSFLTEGNFLTFKEADLSALAALPWADVTDGERVQRMLDARLTPAEAPTFSSPHVAWVAPNFALR